MIGADADNVRRAVIASSNWRNAQLAAIPPVDVQEVRIRNSDGTFTTLTWDTGIVVNGNPLPPDWRLTLSV